MKYLICPKCNEMNTSSTLFCTSCGESLRNAKILESSEKSAAPTEKYINELGAKPQKEVYIALIMGIVFILIPLFVLIGAKDNIQLAGKLFCFVPILFGVGLIVVSIYIIFNPGKANKKYDARSKNNQEQNTQIGAPQNVAIINQCKYLFDAGNYGGVRYWCENTTNPGILGQGSRMPLTDNNQLNNYCFGNFTRCPFYNSKK